MGGGGGGGGGVAYKPTQNRLGPKAPTACSSTRGVWYYQTLSEAFLGLKLESVIPV